MLRGWKYITPIVCIRMLVGFFKIFETKTGWELIGDTWG